MLVYRSAPRQLDVCDTLSDLEGRITGLGDESARTLEDVRSMLIDAGELEAGMVDLECAERDERSVLADAFDLLMQSIGEAFACTWMESALPDAIVERAQGGIRALRTRSFQCGAVEVSTPEGFAFYGLFPETYVDATAKLVRSLQPSRVIVIGIRSIGTTLSAAVAGALRRSGIAVERLTVRPRGHPFDREVRLGEQLTRRLHEAAARTDVSFAIVDEGPGLSGSSFASVIRQLSALGVSEDRIVLCPSWDPETRVLGNDRAQHLWARHRKFVGDFDDAWIRSGRLERAFGMSIARDLSAGAWRELFFAPEGMPAIQPQHERRKFLAERGDERLLIKFGGLNRTSVKQWNRASRAANAGFAAPVVGRAHGFVATRWLEGSPVEARDVGPQLIHRVARYLAWISRCERTGNAANPEPLLEMLRLNADEGLGPEWGDAAARLGRRLATAVAGSPAVRVDGRMLMHEWVRTPTGFVKTDGNSHFDDHFYPGETDIAWDVAAAVIELDLDRGQEHMLVREYQMLSGDRGVTGRLPFMRAAYIAFRLGYTAMAANALGATADGDRMRRAAGQYAAGLKRELSAREVVGQSYATGT